MSTPSPSPDLPAQPLIDGHTHIGTDLLFYLNSNYPYCLDWATLTRMGIDSGIDQFVVFPMVSNLSLNLDAMARGELTTEGAVERVPYRFENARMMQEICGYFPELAHRALPLWMLDPSREQKGQVEALRELATKYPCSGLKIQATIIQSFITDLLKEGRCLMEYAEENNLPVLIHTSVHPKDPWSNVADILKVTEAFPNVRFNMAHSCRFDRPTLDRIGESSNVWFDCSAHRIHCELAARDSSLSVATPDRRFVSDYRDPVTVLGDLAAAYPDKLLWGSDAPFDSYIDHNVALRSSYKAEADTLHALGRETAVRISHTNNLAFLKGL